MRYFLARGPVTAAVRHVGQGRLYLPIVPGLDAAKDLRNTRRADEEGGQHVLVRRAVRRGALRLEHREECQEQRDREDLSVIEELRRQRKPGRTCNARSLSTVDSATGRLVRFILRAELLLPPSSPLPCPGCRERPAARLTHEQLDQAQVSLA